MTRSPDSLIPSRGEQVAVEKRDDKALIGRQEGEANLRAATDVNAVTASSYPPRVGRLSWSISRGEPVPWSEACHGSGPSEHETGRPGRCRGRQHAKTAHRHNRRGPVRSGGGSSRLASDR